MAEFFSPQNLEDLEKPIETARGLPNEAFTSPDFLELERRTLFSEKLGVCGALERSAQPWRRQNG